MSESKLGFGLTAGSAEVVSIFARAFDFASKSALEPIARKEIAITNDNRMTAILHPIGCSLCKGL